MTKIATLMAMGLAGLACLGASRAQANDTGRPAPPINGQV